MSVIPAHPDVALRDPAESAVSSLAVATKLARYVVALVQFGGYTPTRPPVGRDVSVATSSAGLTPHIRSAYGIARLPWRLAIVSRECPRRRADR